MENKSLQEQPSRLVHCTFAKHGEEILDIFNDAILTSTALYEYTPRQLPQIEQWFGTKDKYHFPVLGIEGGRGELRAFGTYGHFRQFPANKYTVEHSIYVARPYRTQGLGSWLLNSLIARAQQEQLHALIGAIDAKNLASCRLHERHGFIRVGTLPEVGFKFGKWLDLALYQRLLDTPLSPEDG